MPCMGYTVACMIQVPWAGSQSADCNVLNTHNQGSCRKACLKVGIPWLILGMVSPAVQVHSHTDLHHVVRVHITNPAPGMRQLWTCPSLLFQTTPTQQPLMQLSTQSLQASPLRSEMRKASAVATKQGRLRQHQHISYEDGTTTPGSH